MNISKSTIVGKIRTAIDDVAPSVTDSFTTDTDNELWQATLHAVQALLEELPITMINPSASSASGTNDTGDGCTKFQLDSDFLRFVDVRLNGWKSVLTELMEPGSEEARRQRSEWTRGTNEKPKAMIDYDAYGNLTLYCWPSGTKTILNYIKKASISGDTITCALKDYTERMVIFRAAAIFFEGKKETDIAAKFMALAATE